MSMFRRECPHYIVQKTFDDQGNVSRQWCIECGMPVRVYGERGWTPIRDMRPHVEAYRRLRTAWHARGWK